MSRLSLLPLIGAVAVIATAAPAASLAAQTSAKLPAVAAPTTAAAALTAIRHSYDHGDYATAVALADSAMRHGFGSVQLQSWRLASLAKLPPSSTGTTTGTTPLRTARRMASMHPDSAWAWVGLALTAAAVPESTGTARTAAAKALALAPNDSVIRRMVGTVPPSNTP